MDAEVSISAKLCRSSFTAYPKIDAEKYLCCPRSTVEIVNRTMYLAHRNYRLRANVCREFCKRRHPRINHMADY